MKNLWLLWVLVLVAVRDAKRKLGLLWTDKNGQKRRGPTRDPRPGG